LVTLITRHHMACRVTVWIGTDTLFSNLVLEIRMEEGQRTAQPLAVIPHQPQFFAHTLFRLEVGVPHDDGWYTATPGNLPPVCHGLPQRWYLETGRHAPLDTEIVGCMPDSVNTGRPVRAVVFVPGHAKACCQGEVIGNEPFILCKQRPLVT